MDSKRLTLTLLMVVAVIVLWNMLFPPPPAKPSDPVGESTESTGPEVRPVGEGPPPSTRPPGPVVAPEAIRRYELSNDLVRLTLSNAGAVIEQVELLDASPTSLVPEGTPLKLVVPSPAGLNALRLEDTDHPAEAWGQALWDATVSGDGRSIQFVREVNRGTADSPVVIRKEKRIRLPGGAARHAEVDFTVEVATPDRNESAHFAILLSGGVFQEVGGQAMSPPRSALYPFEKDIKIFTPSAKAGPEAFPEETLATGRVKSERRLLDDGFRYVADLSNYHGIYFLLRSFPPGVSASVHPLEPSRHWPAGRGDHGESGLRSCSIVQFRASVVSGTPHQWSGMLYFGPVEANLIRDALAGAATDDEVRALGLVYDDQLGWARPVAHTVLWLLKKIYGLVENWGWSIVILTILVRLALFPVNRKSQRAMLIQQEAMNRLKPELDKLKKKYEKDPKKLMEEQMKLYRHHKVSMVPLGGCLPIFLQIPVFFGLFAALRASIDLRQAPWLWVPDLSQPDHLVRFESGVPNPLGFCGGCCGSVSPADITGLHILPILMTAAWIANSYFMPRPSTSTPEQEQMRKMMMFMPVLFGFFMYTYAAGLSLYWLTSSLIGIFESRLIKKLWPVEPANKPGPAVQG